MALNNDHSDLRGLAAALDMTLAVGVIAPAASVVVWMECRSRGPP